MSAKPVVDQTPQLHDDKDVLSKFSHLNEETGGSEEKLKNKVDDDYEDQEMNEYDQMNERFKDVDETMGNIANKKENTSQTKTSRQKEKKTAQTRIGSKRHSIELDLWNDVTSQGRVCLH